MKFTRKTYGSRFINQHIAEITGQHYHHRPTAWVRGDERYSYVTGGMAMPDFEYPGYLLTVGVVHESPGHIVCLDEHHSEDEYDLLDKAQVLQADYGDGVIDTWWGDFERLMPLMGETLVSASIDYDRSDAFQLYITRLKSALSERNKTLQLNGCDHLRNSILSFVREKGQKGQNNPALWVAGALVHTILMARPWERAVKTDVLIPTRQEDYAEYAHREAMRELESELWGL